MRKIEPANVKVNSFKDIAPKKQKVKISKEDFSKKLESFLKKETKTKETDETERSTDEIKSEETDEEGEEDFDSMLNLNWIDLIALESRRDTKATVDLSLESSFELDGIVGSEDQGIILSEAENLFQVTDEGIDLDLNKELMAKFVELLEDGQATKDGSLDSKLKLIDETALQEILADFDGFENKSVEEIEGLLTDYISQRVDDQELDFENIAEGEEIILSESDADKNQKTNVLSMPSKTDSSNQLNVNQEIGFEQMTEAYELDEDQIESIASEKSDLAEIDPENGLVKEDQSLQLDNQDQVFKLASRSDLTDQLETSIKKVPQEEFVSQLESLVVEQSESVDAQDQITTARMQLTPENLGKVDLRIEMQGKDLIAQLIVEKEDTKEWIEQQLSHLKEQLLTQEIHVKDFQVIVHQESMNDTLMDQQENPFFKQKQKETEARRQRQQSKDELVQLDDQKLTRNYSTTNGISILV